MTRYCSIPRCCGKHKALGLCSKHYQRLKIHGSANPPGLMIVGDDEARFNASFTKGPGCWEWTANKTNGYGKFFANGKQHLAHRYSYEKFIGPVPEGILVIHDCMNSGCIRPSHLLLGSYQDNAEYPDRSGERHHNVTIPDAIVREAVLKYQAGYGYQREVAEWVRSNGFHCVTQDVSRWVNGIDRTDATAGLIAT